MGATYQIFLPVRKLAGCAEFRRTLKYGSWLNFADSELNALKRQCLRGRRIGGLDELRRMTGLESRS